MNYAMFFLNASRPCADNYTAACSLTYPKRELYRNIEDVPITPLPVKRTIFASCLGSERELWIILIG